MNETIRNQIDTTIFADHLSAKNREALFSLATRIQRDRGEYLFREGEFDKRVYLLLTGQVDLSMTVPGRGPQRILSVGPGELIAWSSILDDGTMTCSAVCTKPMEGLAIDCDRLRPLTESNRDLGFEFMRMMAAALAKRLLATRLQLLDLFQASVARR